MINNKKYILISILCFIILFISACSSVKKTEDPTVKITQIAQTVQAQITEVIALTPTATPTLNPTNTPTIPPATPTLSTQQVTITSTVAPTSNPNLVDSSVDKAIYVADITIKDGTWIKPGAEFTKTWAIKNTGTTTWLTAYRLAYLEGLQDNAGFLYVHLPQTVKPEETVNVSVTFKAPDELGTYYSYWRLMNFDGQTFGEQMSMKIIVGYE